MVENVMSQYRTEGTTRIRKRVILPKIPSHEREFWTSTSPAEVATEIIEAIVAFAVLDMLVEF